MTDPRTDRIIADAQGLDADLATMTARANTAVSERDHVLADLAAAEQDLATAEQQLSTVTTERAELASSLAVRTAERDTALASLAACQARPVLVPRFAGDPGPGMAYVGSGGGNVDPSSYETAAGRPYGIRRTYWRGDQVAAAVTAAQADHTAGRVPWVSFKLPTTHGTPGWTAARDGQFDAWFADLCARLNALGKPVWLAVHHEPEQDANELDWTAVQARYGPVAHTYPNLAYSIILMGWQQLAGGPPDHSLDALWPGDDAKVKILGFDPYNWYQTSKNGPMVDMDAVYWKPFAAWVKNHPGLVMAVAETGLSDAAFNTAQTTSTMAGRDWMRHSFNTFVARGGVAWAYFDTHLNADATWTWPLGAVGTAKRNAFHEIVNQANSARPR